MISGLCRETISSDLDRGRNGYSEITGCNKVIVQGGERTTPGVITRQTVLSLGDDRAFSPVARQRHSRCWNFLSGGKPYGMGCTYDSSGFVLSRR
ncbi:uncharacterized protein LOC135171572 [Diachasmimorpha longicaudata]|uniref:uncharacterized protein LOC135171572 n=1 Tax=Diachasmimorpha longicaudata TaxID=58733 RepID=UPI0030B89367